jgi:hypothetical protein
MPNTDRREVGFNAEAMAMVVVHSRRAAQTMGLPIGTPTDIWFDPKVAEVTMFYGDSSAQHVLHSARLSALLISYCVRAGIKIPRQLERSMRVDRDAVVLVFGTSCSTPPTTLALEQARTVTAPRASMTWAKEGV